METRANFVIVGLFVIVIIVAAFAGVTWLISGGINNNSREVTIAYPGSVTGLVPGSIVTFNGVPVGRVMRLEFRSSEPETVFVVARVAANAPIKLDSDVTLGLSGLTGMASVQLSGGTRQSASLFALGGRHEIKAKASPVADIMAEAGKVVGKANASLTEFNNILHDNRMTVSNIMRNVEVFSSTLTNNYEHFGRFMSDIDRVVDLLSAVVPKANSLMANMDRILTSVDVEKLRLTVENLHAFSDVITQASQDIVVFETSFKNIANNADKTLANASSMIADIRHVFSVSDLKNLQTTMSNLGSFVSMIHAKNNDVSTIISTAKSIANNFATASHNMLSYDNNIKHILRESNKITSNLSVITTKIDNMLNNNSTNDSQDNQNLFVAVHALIADTSDAVHTFKKTLTKFESDFKTITNEVNRLLNTGMRDIQGIVSDGRKSFRAVERTASDLSNNPQRLLFGKGTEVPEYNNKSNK